MYYMHISGTFDMSARIDALFFIGSQLVSTGRHNTSTGTGGRVGVWNAVSQHWQTQDVISITSYDSAGSFLLLGGINGSINYIGKVLLDLVAVVQH